MIRTKYRLDIDCVDVISNGIYSGLWHCIQNEFLYNLGSLE